MDKLQLTSTTNEIFKLFITDLITTKGITIYRLAIDTNISKYFFYNKLKNNSIQYVSLNTLYIICKHYNFTFDLLKYIKQLECK